MAQFEARQTQIPTRLAAIETTLPAAKAEADGNSRAGGDRERLSLGAIPH